MSSKKKTPERSEPTDAELKCRLIPIVYKELMAIEERQRELKSLSDSDVRRLAILARIVNDHKNYVLNKKIKTITTLDSLSDQELEAIAAG
jgi:hypothetical protein